ncbi:hypothetical protein FK268_02855 [Tsukamurella sputi]|uniref:Uncharacterized protein n=1 Tax=Tsukamurella sputi TaxID=2591848 RepID=A0A5C5RVN7_9ACTN|nr:hypothetical protein [Tsukamurella sputi]TWS26201.1 hypothetical protein FK268_02855 [Tsukamurella sputi]
MRTLHRLSATIDAEHPLPTEDGARVAGTVEVVTECTPTGRAHMRCRVVGDDDWHRIAGGSADLADPADLPFHHSVTLSRLLARPPRPTPVREDAAAFYFCDDLDGPPSAAA